ncbi:MAG: RNA methyltransferase [Oligoflexia bacterium]|nr:RNA methyltransferase [Oligoflexia bacterium]
MFSDQKIQETLSPYISPERMKKIDTILSQRTYTITVVLDNIYDVGNINAVIRTAENLGYQSIYIISSQKTKTTNRITQGTDKWVDIHHFDDYHDCLSSLRAKGYKILATSLTEGRAMPLNELDENIFLSPLAIVFGNEKDGVRGEIVEGADYLTYIPTVGFAQSFNLSVAAGIVLYHVYQKRLNLRGELGQGDLNADDFLNLKSHFYQKSVRRSDKIINYSKGFYR